LLGGHDAVEYLGPPRGLPPFLPSPESASRSVLGLLRTKPSANSPRGPGRPCPRLPTILSRPCPRLVGELAHVSRSRGISSTCCRPVGLSAGRRSPCQPSFTAPWSRRQKTKTPPPIAGGRPLCSSRAPTVLVSYQVEIPEKPSISCPNIGSTAVGRDVRGRYAVRRWCDRALDEPEATQPSIFSRSPRCCRTIALSATRDPAFTRLRPARARMCRSHRRGCRIRSTRYPHSA